MWVAGAQLRPSIEAGEELLVGGPHSTIPTTLQEEHRSKQCRMSLRQAVALR